MLVITQSALENLNEELKFCQYGDQHWRCVIIKCSLAKNKPEHWFSFICDKINFSFGNEGTIYLFPDDDVYIFSRTPSTKSVSALYQSLGDYFSDIPQSVAILLYELPVHLDYLKTAFKEKQPKVSTTPEPVKPDITPRSVIQDPDYLPIVKTISERRAARPRVEVMVSEDDPFSSRLVCKTIDTKYASLATFDGKKTIETYIFNAPNVLFLDIGLPDMNGLEILSSIFAADPEAYVVIISANGNKENVMKAIRFLPFWRSLYDFNLPERKESTDEGLFP